jgi:hypothetical protein
MLELQQQQSPAARAQHHDRRATGNDRYLPERQRTALLISATASPQSVPPAA